MSIGLEMDQERENDYLVGNISLTPPIYISISIYFSHPPTYLRVFLILTAPLPPPKYFPQVPSWTLVSRLSDVCFLFLPNIGHGKDETWFYPMGFEPRIIKEKMQTQKQLCQQVKKSKVPPIVSEKKKEGLGCRFSRCLVTRNPKDFDRESTSHPLL